MFVIDKYIGRDKIYRNSSPMDGIEFNGIILFKVLRMSINKYNINSR